MQVLIADDDHDLAQMVGLCVRLLWPDCGLAFASDGQETLRRFATDQPDLVILDVTMPPPDGLAVCRELRSMSPVPILMLTGQVGTAAETRALDLGADMYMTKPFDLLRLQARLRSLARRADAVAAQEVPQAAPAKRAALRIDPATREVWIGDTRIELSPTEYVLLDLLARQRGTVVDQRTLIDHAWGHAAAGTPHSLKVYINRIRRKLGDRPGRPVHIHNRRGVGYRLTTE